MIKLSNYKIIKKIASGGMGDVYLAEHETLGNKVAIKSLHSNLVHDESFRKRFITEAKTHHKLSHPNIVKLLDFQIQEHGLFLIMEYVEGKQLNDYINKVTGPIPEKKLTALFLQILSAIEYAHSKKLIHRDIKPANILITKEEKVKVIDFGIAKQSEEDHGLTKTGVQVGTVSYMSPEQVNAEKVDFLTDIYSLGILLFQMAVGKSPYSKETNAFKIQLKIVNDPLPNAKDIYPSISDKLVSIIYKATQKKKKDRYQSCEEFKKVFSKKAVASTNIKSKQKEVTKKEKTQTVNLNKSRSNNSAKSYKNRSYVAILSLFIFVILGFLFYKSTLTNSNSTNIDTVVSDIDKTLTNDTIDPIGDTNIGDTDIKRKNKERTRLLEAENKRLREAEESRKRVAANKQKNEPKFITEKIDNGTYKGWSKKGKWNGKGKFTWHSGDVYEGDFVNNKRNGKGKFTWHSGNVYEGDWVNGSRTGKGKIIWNDGDVYEGDFVNGDRTGKGKYTWTNGNVYEGDFVNGDRTGKGKFTTWTNGDVYEGDFVNGNMSGRGKKTYKSGIFSVGIWENDKLIKEDKINIRLSRSNSEKNNTLNYLDRLRYSVYINDIYKTTLFVGDKYTYNADKPIEVSPGDFIEIKRNMYRQKKWWRDCTSFIVQEKKYIYSITCNSN